MSGPYELAVSGGANGFQARYADLSAMAGLSEQTCGDLLATALQCHAMLVDGDVLASAVLDPGGAIAFEAALLGALDGSGGLTRVAGDVGLRALGLRAGAAEYRLRDAASQVLFELGAFIDVAGAGLDLPFTVGDSIGALLTGGNPKAAWEKLLTDHPGVADEFIQDVPIALWLASSGQLPPTEAGIAHLLGLFYPDGKPVVAEIPFVDPANAELGAPRSMADLLAGLDARNAPSTGQIDVRVLQRWEDGELRRAYVVDIPGMNDFSLHPGDNPGSVNDVPTTLHAMAGDPGSYAGGVAEALHRAGASTTDPVMLVGHSQGGMVAVRAAEAFTADGSYNVTHVVTAGSPIAHMSVPDGVQLLALEGNHDIVPHLDGADNAAASNITTVTFETDFGTVDGNHSLHDAYLPVGAALDGSSDPSVEAYLDSAQNFMSATSVDNHAYTIHRGY